MGRHKYPPAVVFRLDSDNVQELSARAEKLGVSIHQLARHYTLEALGEKEKRRLEQQAIYALQQEIATLREDLTLCVEVLLVSAGKVSENDARDWVRENFEKP